MARLIICGSVPSFTKEVEIDAETISQEIIEDEVTKRMRTLLGIGKITCHAEFNCDVPDVGDNGYSLWGVDILSGTGVHFASIWVRAFA